MEVRSKDRTLAIHGWWSSHGKHNTGEHWWGGTCWWGMIGVGVDLTGWGVGWRQPEHLVAKVPGGQAISFAYFGVLFGAWSLGWEVGRVGDRRGIVVGVEEGEVRMTVGEQLHLHVLGMQRQGCGEVGERGRF